MLYAAKVILLFNLLLHRLFLDQEMIEIIVLFLDNMEKIPEKFKLSFGCF